MGQVAAGPRMRPWHVPMTGVTRLSLTEPRRPSSSCSTCASLWPSRAPLQALHHDLVVGQLWHGLVNYLVIFFAIWSPWMNFTWFASANDTDDVDYRLLTFVQIAGSSSSRPAFPPR